MIIATCAYLTGPSQHPASVSLAQHPGAWVGLNPGVL